MRTKAPLILVFVLITGSLIAQNSVQYDLFTKFENISTQNGLSNDMVQDIIQDNFGFIWIATADGLNRYDGYSLKYFKNSIDDSTSISGNYITCLELDQYNNLWVGTTEGLNLYVREKNQFIQFLNSSSKNSISNNHVRQLFAEEGFLWIETLDGILNKFDIHFVPVQLYYILMVPRRHWHYQMV